MRGTLHSSWPAAAAARSNLQPPRSRSPQQTLNFFDRRRPRPRIDQRKNALRAVRDNTLDGVTAALNCSASHHDIYREVTPAQDCLNLLSRGRARLAVD